MHIAQLWACVISATFLLQPALFVMAQKNEHVEIRLLYISDQGLLCMQIRRIQIVSFGPFRSWPALTEKVLAIFTQTIG